MDAVKNPFVAFLFPLLFGIITGITFHIHLQIIYYSFFLIPLLFYFILEKKIFRFNTKLFGIYAYLILFILGIFTVDVHRKSKADIDTKNTYLYEGIISEQPKTKPKSIQIIIDIQAYKDSSTWQKIKTRTVLYLQKDSTLSGISYGDRIIFEAKLNPIKNAGNPNEFDYESFMAHKNIYYTAFVKSKNFLVLEHKQANAVIYSALNIRQKLMNIYQRFGIENQKFAVLSALTLGYRDEIDRETRQMFADTGAMHILAVSGLHVGIIFMILTNLLAFMDKKRSLMLIKSVIIIFSLWFFATIAGLSPSVMRSALMFSLFVIGKMLLRSTSVYNIIFSSAFVLLLINPYDILSVGFQLSYAAVLAIVFFQPHIYKLFAFKHWFPDKLWALTTVSIAAQLGTMPIGLYYFHQFPNYFFLTNILVIPMASMILYVAVFLFTVSFIPYLNAAVAFVLKVLLKWLIGGVSFIDSLPYATLKDIYISSSQMILIYIIIMSFSLFWILNRKQLLYLMFISLILFLCIDIQINYNNNKDDEFVIYNVHNSSSINLLTDKNILIADEKTLNDQKSLNYSLKPYWQKKRVCNRNILKFNIDTILSKDTIIRTCKTKENSLQMRNIRFYFIRNSRITNFSVNKKLKVDYLVLSNNVYVKLAELKQLFDFNKIIFDSSNKDWRVEKWEKEAEKLKISYFDINKQGAWGIDIDSGKELKF